MVKEVKESTRSSSRLQKLGVSKPAPVEKKTKKSTANKETKVTPAEKESPKKAIAASSPAGKWKVGGQISEIVLSDQDSNEVNLSEVAKSSGFVVFFYPAANTPGCTNQALCYKEDYDKFTKAGYKVFGCSKDGAKSQTTFKTKYSFPYQLLCDPERKLIAAIGAKTSDNKTIRSHVVVAKGGKVMDIVLKVPAKESASKALDLIQTA